MSESNAIELLTSNGEDGPSYVIRNLAQCFQKGLRGTVRQTPRSGRSRWRQRLPETGPWQGDLFLANLNEGCLRLEKFPENVTRHKLPPEVLDWPRLGHCQGLPAPLADWGGCDLIRIMGFNDTEEENKLYLKSHQKFEKL